MKKILLWVLAFLITAFTAVYQRRTGPTYPLNGKVKVNGTDIAYTLPRSHEIGSDCAVEIQVKNPEVQGTLSYRRHKSPDPWTDVPMSRRGDRLIGFLPEQPPAGKLRYRIMLSGEDTEVSIPESRPAIIRFKGVVPEWVLIPHVIVMFLAMLFSARAGIEALRPGSNPRTLALWTAGFLFIGGFILGPLVQKLAFGSFWTGFPFGFDLTDNKTLIAMIGWAAALIAGRGGRPARGWVLGAALLMLVVFLIPHSLLGSELDYTSVESVSRM